MQKNVQNMYGMSQMDVFGGFARLWRVMLRHNRDCKTAATDPAGAGLQETVLHGSVQIVQNGEIEF